MLILRQVVSDTDAGGRQDAVGGALTLTFEERRRSRRLARLDDGREAALQLPRGTVLVDGQLIAVEGEAWLVVVRAAEESLSVARAADPHLLARAAYHLGNRHVPVQIGAGWVAYEHDHVLDGMVRALGLAVEARRQPFEPEAGGYRHDNNNHHHDHRHHHHHDHDHHGGNGHDH
jgi:urease accessory protein